MNVRYKCRQHVCYEFQHSKPKSGEATAYKSIDTVINPDEIVNYLTKFFSSLDLPDMSIYMLSFKIGVPIILLGNINDTTLQQYKTVSKKINK